MMPVSASSDGGSVRTGLHLGAYHVLGHVASGSTGEFWLALDPEHQGRFVVLKILQPWVKVKRSEFLASLQQKVALVSRLQHPNLTTVIGLERCDEHEFLVLEHVPGKSLERLPMTPPVDLSLLVMLQVCQALDFVHTQTFVTEDPTLRTHLCLSPSKVVIGYSGRVKLLGLGASQATQRLQDIPSFVRYARFAFYAPEQLRGGEVGPEADIYSAGATLYYLLTGSSPFSGNSLLQLIQRVTEGNPPALTLLNPDVPGLLEEIVQRAMHPDPSARFASAAAFGQALRVALEALPDVRTSKRLRSYVQSALPDMPNLDGLLAPLAAPPPPSSRTAEHMAAAGALPSSSQPSRAGNDSAVVPRDARPTPHYAVPIVGTPAEIKPEASSAPEPAPAPPAAVASSTPADAPAPVPATPTPAADVFGARPRVERHTEGDLFGARPARSAPRGDGPDLFTVARPPRSPRTADPDVFSSRSTQDPRAVSALQAEPRSGGGPAEEPDRRGSDGDPFGAARRDPARTAADVFARTDKERAPARVDPFAARTERERETDRAMGGDPFARAEKERDIFSISAARPNKPEVETTFPVFRRAGDGGRRTPPPVSGSRTPPPVSGSRTPPPVSGSRTPPPVSGSRTPPPLSERGRSADPWKPAPEQDSTRDASAHFDEGVAALRRGDREAAVRELEIAVSLDPENRLYRSNLALLKASDGD